MDITIRDVAKLAGVSISTVSRVVNQKGLVTPEKEQRVLAAVEALQYKPNAIAQSLKHKKTKLIGMMTSDLSVSFFVGILQFLEKNLLAEGYQILVANTYDNPETEQKLVDLMAQGRVDLILINSTGGNDARMASLQSSGICFLGYDRYPSGNAFSSVYVDKTAGIYQLLAHLYRLGHRRMCFITGPARLSTNRDRREGIHLFLKDYGLPEESVSIYEEEFSEGFARRVVAQTIYGENAPTAYITGSVVLAMGIIMYCEEQGISIPGDISLASFGTFRYGDMVRPSLLHIDDAYAEVAAQLLEWIRMVEGDEPVLPKTNRVIQPQLVPGDSCGVPRNYILHPANERAGG